MSHGDHNHYFFKKIYHLIKSRLLKITYTEINNQKLAQITTVANQKNTIMITMETITRKSTIMALQLIE